MKVEHSLPTLDSLLISKSSLPNENFAFINTHPVLLYTFTVKLFLPRYQCHWIIILTYYRTCLCYYLVNVFICLSRTLSLPPKIGKRIICRISILNNLYNCDSGWGKLLEIIEFQLYRALQTEIHYGKQIF